MTRKPEEVSEAETERFRAAMAKIYNQVYPRAKPDDRWGNPDLVRAMLAAGLAVAPPESQMEKDRRALQPRLDAKFCNHEACDCSNAIANRALSALERLGYTDYPTEK